MQALWLLGVIACWTAPAKSPVTQPAVAGPCASDGEVLANGGTLVCRELPVAITFPVGLKVVRQNRYPLTVYLTELEGGFIGLLVEPTIRDVTADMLTEYLTAFVKNSSGTSITPIVAPPLAGARVSVALSFNWREGEGVLHGYFANDFIVASFATKNSHTRTFLGSLELRRLATGTKRFALQDGAYVELPAAAWLAGVDDPSVGVGWGHNHIVPGRKIWIGVRELDPTLNHCNYLKGNVPDAPRDLGDRLRVIYSKGRAITDVDHGKYGDVSVFGQITNDSGRLVMYVICAGATIVEISVTGTNARTTAELRSHLDEIAKTVVGAKR